MTSKALREEHRFTFPKWSSKNIVTTTIPTSIRLWTASRNPRSRHTPASPTHPSPYAPPLGLCPAPSPPAPFSPPPPPPTSPHPTRFLPNPPHQWLEPLVGLFRALEKPRAVGQAAPERRHCGESVSLGVTNRGSQGGWDAAPAFLVHGLVPIHPGE